MGSLSTTCKPRERRYPAPKANTSVVLSCEGHIQVNLILCCWLTSTVITVPEKLTLDNIVQMYMIYILQSGSSETWPYTYMLPMLSADSRFWLANNRERPIPHVWSHQRDIYRERNVIDDVTIANPTTGITLLWQLWKRLNRGYTSFGHWPCVVLRCCVWINSRIRVSQQGGI